MSNPTTTQAINAKLARAINDDARQNPQSPYAGKFVGIADGKLAAVADDLDELVRRLAAAGHDPQRTLCLEAGLDYDAVQDVWGPA